MDDREEIIFEAALRISSAAEREAYLEEACGDDLTLLSSVRSLLEAYAAGEFLEQTIPAIAAAKEQAPGLPLSIGPYRLLSQLGEGGMGTVFLAEQQHPVARRVALKVIREDRITTSSVRRFLQEQRTLSLMDHPNIATVLDAGTTGVGQPWFAMELVNGIPILKYCQQKNPDLRMRLRMILECCQAIQHAHQKRILHRDIKPSNVLIMEVDGDPVVKLIDFGVAKPISRDSSATGDTHHTLAGDLVGTPQYMSPEQAARSSGEIDTRADIYSVGALLYTVLTGVPPFDPQRMLEADSDEIRRILMNEEPVRPSVRVRQQKRQESDSKNSVHASSQSGSLRISSELDSIVLKAMEKNPDYRYQTIGELAEDIEAYLDSRPIRARAPSTLYYAGKFAKRHRGFLTAVAAAVLCLVIGLAAAVRMSIIAASHEKAAKQIADEGARQLYSSNMLAASNAFLSQDTRTLRTFLEPYSHIEEGSPVAPGFDWHFLNRCTKTSFVPILRQKKALYTSCWLTADTVATAGEEGVISVCSVNPPKELQKWKAGQGEVNGLAKHPNEPIMASSGDDGTLAFWNTETWEEEGSRIRAGKWQAFHCVWSPDGQYIATCGNEPGIRIYRFADRSLVREISTERDMECLTVSANGLLAAGAEGGKIYLQQFPDSGASFPESQVLPDVGQTNGAHCTALHFVGTGDFLAAGYKDGRFVLLQLRAPVRIQQETRFADTVECLTDGPTDDELIAGLKDGSLGYIQITDTVATPLIDLTVYRDAAGGTMSVSTDKANSTLDEFAPACCEDADQDMTDRTFGNNGVTVFPQLIKSPGFEDLLVTDEGHMLLAGVGNQSGQGQLALLQLDGQGQPVPGFGDNGFKSTEIGLGIQSAGGTSFDSKRRIVRTCSVVGETHFYPAIVRYLPTGAYDISFGFDGKLALPQSDCSVEVMDHCQLADDSVIIACNCRRNEQEFVRLLKVHSDGRADQSFGTNGVVDIARPGLSVKCRHVSKTSDQKILLLWSQGSSADNAHLQRFDANGKLDPSFGMAGSVVLHSSQSVYPKFLVTLSDGGITVASVAWNGKRNVTLLERFRADGTVDSRFGNGGVCEVAVGNSCNCTFGGMLAMRDDSLLLSLSRQGAVGDELALVAVTPGGQILRSFGTQGHWFASFGAENTRVGPIVSLRNGRFCAAGIQGGEHQGRFAFLGFEDVREPAGILLCDTAKAEEHSAGTTVGWLVTQNFLRSDGIQFQLVSGEGDDDNECFEIQGHYLICREEMSSGAMANASIRLRATDARQRTVEQILRFGQEGETEKTAALAKGQAANGLLRFSPPVRNGRLPFTQRVSMEYRSEEEAISRTDRLLSKRRTIFWNTKADILNFPESIIVDENRRIVTWPDRGYADAIPRDAELPALCRIVSNASITSIDHSPENNSLIATLDNGALLHIPADAPASLQLVPGDAFYFGFSATGRLWTFGETGTVLSGLTSSEASSEFTATTSTERSRVIEASDHREGGRSNESEVSPGSRFLLPSLGHPYRSSDNDGFVHRGSTLASAANCELSRWHSDDRALTQIRKYDLDDQAEQVLVTLPDNERLITHCEMIQADEKKILLISREPSVSVDQQSECELIAFQNPDFQQTGTLNVPAILQIRPSSSGRFAALIHRGGTTVIKVSPLTILFSLQLPDLSDVAISPDDTELCTVTGDRQLSLWNLIDGTPGLTVNAHRVAVRSVDYCPDGLTIGTVGEDGTLRFWRRDRLRQTMELPFGTPLRKIRFFQSPSSRLLAVQTESHRVFLLNAK